MRWILTWIALLLPASLLQAATLNVPSQHATIQAALNAANAGDTILVASGTYNESNLIVQDSNLTIQSATPRGAIINAGGNANGFGVPASNVDGVVIDGFEIRNASTSCIALAGGNNNFDNWIIRNNYIHHCGLRGVNANGNGHRIENNEIAYIGNEQEAYGISFLGGNGKVADGNVIYFVRKNPIRIATGGDATLINNLIQHSGPGIAINASTGGNDISNNYIYHTATGFIPKHSSCTLGNDRFIHNTVYDIHESNLVLAENTPAGNCIFIRNNVATFGGLQLIQDQTNNRGTNVSLNFNFYDPTSTMYIDYGPNPDVVYATLTAYQIGTGFDPNSTTGTPNLADPSTGPALASNSPVLTFTGENVGGNGGLGTVVGARTTRTFPFRFVPPDSITVTAASSNLANAPRTINGVCCAAWQSAAGFPQSITYQIGGTPAYDHLRIRSHSNAGVNHPNDIAVDVSTNGTDFTQVATGNMGPGTLANPSWFEIGNQTASFVRVRFLNAKGGTSVWVDEVEFTKKTAVTAPPPPPTTVSTLINTQGQITNPALYAGDNTDISGCTDLLYFDNADGSDVENCLTPGTACKSMTKFKTFALGADDCTLFRCNSVWTDEDPEWHNRGSGTSGNPIIFGAYDCSPGDERPKWVFTGDGPTFNFSNRSWIVLDRLQDDGADTIRWTNGSHDITINKMYRKDVENAAFGSPRGAFDPPFNLTFMGVVVDGAGPLTGITSGTGEAFYMDLAHSVTLRDFYFTRLANECISIKEGSTNILAENGLCEGNRRADDPGFINTRNIIDVNAAITIRNVVVRNNANTVGSNHPALFFGEGTTGYNLIVHNNSNAYGFRGAASSKLYHSIFYQPGLSFLAPENLTPAANIKNNIAATTIAGNLDITDATFGASLFADPANDFFRHCAGCAGIDLYADCNEVAIDIEGKTRPQNGTCDAGAFEFTASEQDAEDFIRGVIAHWTFDSTLADAVGTFPLLYSGATPTYITAQIGNGLMLSGDAFAFPGVNTLGATSLHPRPGSPYSVSTRFRSTLTGTIIAKAVENAADRDMQIAITATDLDIYMAGAITNTVGDYNDGQWHHISVVWDGNVGRYYIDGGVEQGTLNIGTSPEDTNEPIIIGARTSGAGFRLTGDLDDMWVHNRALTAAQVAALAAWDGDNTAPSAPTGLTLTPLDASRLQLNWTPSADDHGIAAYHIEACTGASCSNFFEVDTILEPPYVAFDLTEGILYRFRVRARDSFGLFSSYSTIAEGTPSTPTGGMAIISGGLFTGGMIGGGPPQ